MMVVDQAKKYRANVRAGMVYAGFTGKDMAKKLGMDPCTFSRKMNGLSFSETEMLVIQRLFRWENIGGEA